MKRKEDSVGAYKREHRANGELELLIGKAAGRSRSGNRSISH